MDSVSQKTEPNEFIGKVLYCDSSLSVELRKYPKGYSMPFHKHDYLTVSLLLRGSLVEDTEKGSVQPHSGFLSIKPQDITHRDVFVNDCTFLSLKIFDPRYYGLDFQDWRWTFPNGIIAYLFNVVRERDKRQAINNVADFLREVDEKESLPVPRWLSHVHEIVCHHYKESFQIKDVAREVGKHPFHLGRTFEKFYGTDIISYRQNLRLHHALSETVTNTHKTLTEIAHEHGFSDQSHFTREFKKVMTITPKKAISFLQV